MLDTGHLCNQGGEIIAVFVALVGHGLEFEHFEKIAILAQPFVIEDLSGSFVGEMEPDGDSRLGQREHEQSQCQSLA